MHVFLVPPETLGSLELHSTLPASIYHLIEMLLAQVANLLRPRRQEIGTKSEKLSREEKVMRNYIYTF